MAITNATRLSDFGAGIGTQGAIIQVDNANARLGIGTTNPTAMLSVGPNANIIMDGIAGVITATSIAASATGLTGTPSVTVNLVSATDVNVSGSATIDGHLSVAGTITHEDVTNVDSVGIVTARQGLRVLAGGIQVVGLTTGLRASGISTFGGGSGGDIQIQGSAAGVTSCLWNASDDRFEFYDNSKATFGDSADLSVYHTGGNNYITGTPNLYVQSNSAVALRTAGQENMVVATANGSVSLYHDNAKKIETINQGAIVTGITSTTQLSVGPGVVRESYNEYGSAMNGTYNQDILTHGMSLYSSSNATASFVLNLRGDGSTTFNSLIKEGESTVFTLYAGSNNTSYYLTDFQIDGSSITEEWAGATAPSAGTGSGYDVYTFNILKTGNAAFKVFANFTNFN